MISFFILVMDQYKDDLQDWLYSAYEEAANSQDMDCEKTTLNELRCYVDPPNSLPKEGCEIVCSKRIRIPPCSGGDPEGGTIYGIKKI